MGHQPAVGGSQDQTSDILPARVRTIMPIPVRRPRCSQRLDQRGGRSASESSDQETLDLLGVRDLVLDLVGDFQSALVQAARRVGRARGRIGASVSVQLNFYDESGSAVSLPVVFRQSTSTSSYGECRRRVERGGPTRSLPRSGRLRLVIACRTNAGARRTWGGCRWRGSGR